MLVRFGAVVSLGMILAMASGCSPSSSDSPRQREERTAAVPLRWTVAPENSKVLEGDTPEALSVIRCWPDGDGYDCVNIHVTTGPRTDIIRFWTKTLPKIDDSPSTGYECSFGGVGSSVEEAIVRDGKSLVGNDFTGINGTKPWMRSYVDGFMKENNLNHPSRYFDCDTLVKIIQSGSYESINSTALKHEML